MAGLCDVRGTSGGVSMELPYKACKVNAPASISDISTYIYIHIHIDMYICMNVYIYICIHVYLETLSWTPRVCNILALCGCFLISLGHYFAYFWGPGSGWVIR